jgi:hypothetical protein
MAADELLVRELVALGLSYRVAIKLADPTTDTINGGAVADPAAVTAPAQMGASYTQANVNALQADVVALRTTVAALVTALKTAGVIT